MKKQTKTDALEKQNNALKCAIYDALFTLSMVANSDQPDTIDCQSMMRCVIARLEVGIDYAEAQHD